MTPEQAKALRSSESWSYFCKEIDMRVATIKEQLISCRTEDLEALQLRARILNEVKRMPDDVIDREE